MPDPLWTAQYNFGATPEANSFTRTVNGGVVNAVTGGPAANRRVEINSDNGEAVFITSNVPALNSQVGITMEIGVSCTGAGDAGIETTFLDMAIGFQVYAGKVSALLDATPGEPVAMEVNTPSNGVNTLFRITIDGSRNFRAYRSGALVMGPTQIPASAKPFQRILFWGEGGGIQIFRAMRYWLGGAMAPG